MYLLIDEKTRKIVGTAVRPVCEVTCSKNGQRVYQIDDEEYSDDMLGKILEDYDSGD